MRKDLLPVLRGKFESCAQLIIIALHSLLGERRVGLGFEGRGCFRL